MQVKKQKTFKNGMVYCLALSDGMLVETTDTFLPYYTKDAIGRKQNFLDNDNLGSRAERLMYFRDNKRVRVVAQPFRDLDNPNQVIPQWQRDMARWAMRREFWATMDFKAFEPRKGFVCGEYFKSKELSAI